MGCQVLLLFLNPNCAGSILLPYIITIVTASNISSRICYVITSAILKQDLALRVAREGHGLAVVSRGAIISYCIML